MARFSPPRAWFYLKKRQSMGMGLGENVYPGRNKPDDGLGGGGNFPGTAVPQFIAVNGQRYQLLLGHDGQYLIGADGSALYGRAA